MVHVYVTLDGSRHEDTTRREVETSDFKVREAGERFEGEFAGDGSFHPSLFSFYLRHSRGGRKQNKPKTQLHPAKLASYPSPQ